MARYYKEMRVFQDQGKAIEACIQHELRPIVATSIGLALGFGALTLSTMLPLVHFGLLAALVMLFALIADLFITPILLSSTQLLTLWDMLTLDLKDAVIQYSPLFRNLKSWHIKKMVLLGKILNKAQGETLIRAGGEGKSMYLLLEGHVQVMVMEPQTQKQTAVADVRSDHVLFHRSSALLFIPTKHAFNFGKGQIWDVKTALNIEGRPSNIFDVQHTANTDQRDPMQQILFFSGLTRIIPAAGVHIPKGTGQAADNVFCQGLKFIKNQHQRLV